MATKKAAGTGKRTAPAAAPVKRKREAPGATGTSRPEPTDTRQLLREAAWRQMFGKAQSKSPFGR